MPEQDPPASGPRTDYAGPASSRAVADTAIERMMAGSVVVEHRVGRRRHVVRTCLVAGIGTAVLGGLFLFANLDLVHRPPDVAVGADGVREVTLEQDPAGHYFVRGTIDGRDVGFLLDTGATAVAIPEHVAERLGLARGLPQRTMTANGIGRSFATRIGTLSIGGIERHDVDASISPGLIGDSILLGMSFLRELTLEQRDGTLTIRDD